MLKGISVLSLKVEKIIVKIIKIRMLFVIIANCQTITKINFQKDYRVILKHVNCI